MNTKTTLVLAILAIGVAVAGYFLLGEEGGSTATTEKATTSAKALFDPKPESKDIDRVELVSKDSKFLFKKQDGAWNIVEPIQALASEFEVNAIIDRAAEVKYTRAYEKSDKERPSPGTSGLDKPQASVKLYKGDGLAAELVVGDRLPVGKGCYVAKGGSDSVYEAQADLSSTFNKRMDALRDKRVIKCELKEVKRVKVEGLQNFELARSGDDWVIESPARGRADKDRAERVARPMTTLNAQEWKDEKPVSLRPYGLDRPRLKVTMDVVREIPAKFKPGDAGATRPADTQPSSEPVKYVLLVGGATDNSGNSFFAKIESGSAVFSLAQTTVNDLSAQLADLRDKTIAKIADPASVTKVEAEIPDGSFVLTRNEKNEWMLGGAGQADASAVDDLVKAVANMKAADFADPRDPMMQVDWKKPRARMTLTRRGEANPVTVLVGPPSPSGKMVYVRNAAEDAVAVVRDSDVEQLLAPAIAYQDRSVLKFPRERATKIEVARSGKPAVTISKKNNVWSLTSPVSEPADVDTARNLLQDLSALRAKRVVGSGDKARYGLDGPGVKLAVWVEPLTADPNTKVVGQTTQPTSRAATSPAGHKPSLQELLDYQKKLPNANPKMTELLEEMIAKEKAAAATRPGGAASQPGQTPDQVAALKELTDKVASRPASQPAEPVVYRLLVTRKDGVTYAAREDQPAIYELDGRLYEDAVAELHDRQVLRFDPNAVTDVAFEANDARVVLRKSGEEWKYLPDPVVPIDKQKVTDVLNAFRDLKTHAYVAYTDADPAQYGLDKGYDRFSVTLDGKTSEVLLSRTGPQGDTDKSRYAMLAGAKKVFLLKGDQAAKFAQKLEDFEKKAGPAAPAGPAGMPPGAAPEPME